MDDTLRVGTESFIKSINHFAWVPNSSWQEHGALYAADLAVAYEGDSFAVAGILFTIYTEKIAAATGNNHLPPDSVKIIQVTIKDSGLFIPALAACSINITSSLPASRGGVVIPRISSINGIPVNNKLSLFNQDFTGQDINNENRITIGTNE
jgi:hypothetical protein